VLVNQCPHQLDLFQWLFGMPEKLRAFCALGRYHNIEVEDDVSALMKFADGKTATIITSTGEAPGSNRLEIAAERGRLLLEDGKLSFKRNIQPISEYSHTTTKMFGSVEHWNVEIPFSGDGAKHVVITNNFADAILDGAPLIAPAEEGIKSVELANAMLMSSFLDKDVKFPIKSAVFAKMLKEKIANSKIKKKVKAVAGPDFAASLNKP